MLCHVLGLRPYSLHYLQVVQGFFHRPLRGCSVLHTSSGIHCIRPDVVNRLGPHVRYVYSGCLRTTFQMYDVCGCLCVIQAVLACPSFHSTLRARNAAGMQKPHRRHTKDIQKIYKRHTKDIQKTYEKRQLILQFLCF